LAFILKFCANFASSKEFDLVLNTRASPARRQNRLTLFHSVNKLFECKCQVFFSLRIDTFTINQPSGNVKFFNL